MAAADTAATDQHVEAEERVTPLELFFDLVFVFAITQVTTIIASHPTWETLGQGLLILAALWWAWTGYAWLTNSLDPERTQIRLLVLLAMVAMFVVALAAPEAFGSRAWVFGVAYATVRMIHASLYSIATRVDRQMHSAVVTLVPTFVIGPALILAAAAFDGTVQAVIWCLALAIDFGGPVITGVTGFRVHASHFAERHGSIVIIALGESIVALGVGAQGLDLGPGLIAAAVFGMVIVVCLWWHYFDVVAIVAEQRLTEVTGEERARMARDSYSYLHLPMIAGIILFAVGVKKTLIHLHDPLDAVPAVALCGGISMYLLAHIAFRLRNVRTVSPRRLVVAGTCLALIPVALNVSALLTLGILSGLLAGLITYEVIRYREARGRLRESVSGGTQLVAD